LGFVKHLNIFFGVIYLQSSYLVIPAKPVLPALSEPVVSNVEPVEGFTPRRYLSSAVLTKDGGLDYYSGFFVRLLEEKGRKLKN